MILFRELIKYISGNLLIIFFKKQIGNLILNNEIKK